MRNEEVAKVFGEIADLLDIKGDNPFRIRAYRRAANLESKAHCVVALGQLRQIRRRLQPLENPFASKVL